MTANEPVLRKHGNAYNIFILVLTIYSLAIMVLLLLPIDQATRDLVTVYDNAICVIFLIDFAMNLAGAHPRRGYFIGQRGWLDLLGSLPSLEIFQIGALLRLARLSRLARITRLLRGKAGKDLVVDVLTNRGQYATFITILLAGMVLSVASILVLQFESVSPDANIKTGGDALWWGIVTITTVGYGDRYPVTMLGRTTATAVMFAGIGIIGALASILASLLVAPATPAEAAPATPAEAVTETPAEAVTGTPAEAAPERDPGVLQAESPQATVAGTGTVAEELAALRAEVGALRESLATARVEPGGDPVDALTGRGGHLLGEGSSRMSSNPGDEAAAAPE